MSKYGILFSKCGAGEGLWEGLIVSDNKGKCFVIMPISDPDGYEKGHFKMIYEDVFSPAIKQAGYTPFRADDSNASNLIQEKIVREIIESPMALCDLSTRNPNVLFELGIRQAFDLPVVLVQEEGTKRIFDIGNINTLDYDKNMQYRNVIQVQEKIKNAIIETENPSNGVNSIIKLLKVAKAQIPDQDNMTELDEVKMLINSVRNELEGIREDAKKQARGSSLIVESMKPYEVTPDGRRRIRRVYLGKDSDVYDAPMNNIRTEHITSLHNENEEEQ